MNARSDHSARWPRDPAGVVESLAFKVGALIAMATLAIFLWQYAIGSIAYGASVIGTPTTAEATVEQCPRGIGVRDRCIVNFTDHDGRYRTAELEHPGLFSHSPGDRVTIAVHDGGAVGVAGWQPVADAGLLALLAIAVTGYAIGWWRRVLEHHDPLYDGGDPLDDITTDQRFGDSDTYRRED